MLTWASPRFLSFQLSFSLVQVSTPQIRALLLRFQRKLLYWARDTLRFPLSNHREYRTRLDCRVANPQCILLNIGCGRIYEIWVLFFQPLFIFENSLIVHKLYQLLNIITISCQYLITL